MGRYDEKRRLVMLRFSGGSGEPQETQGPQEADTRQEPQKLEKTYTRDELNKIINAEVNKAKEQERAKLDEAAKLEKMQEDERTKYEKEQAEKRAEEALLELNAYKLKDQASRIAGEAGLPQELLGLMDFKSLSAEQVSAGIESMSKAFNAALEKSLNERLRQSPPETHRASPNNDYSKLKEDALARGDMVAFAYYTRMEGKKK